MNKEGESKFMELVNLRLKNTILSKRHSTNRKILEVLALKGPLTVDELSGEIAYQNLLRDSIELMKRIEIMKESSKDKEELMKELKNIDNLIRDWESMERWEGEKGRKWTNTQSTVSNNLGSLKKYDFVFEKQTGWKSEKKIYLTPNKGRDYAEVISKKVRDNREDVSRHWEKTEYTDEDGIKLNKIVMDIGLTPALSEFLAQMPLEIISKFNINLDEISNEEYGDLKERYLFEILYNFFISDFPKFSKDIEDLLAMWVERSDADYSDVIRLMEIIKSPKVNPEIKRHLKNIGKILLERDKMKISRIKEMINRVERNEEDKT